VKVTLRKLDGKPALVLDDVLIRLVGAESTTEWDLSTDGRRFILTPCSAVPPERIEAVAPRAAAPSPKPGEPDFRIARKSADLLERLRDRDEDPLTPSHFQRIHHFQEKASLEAHINYCRGTEQFRSKTNVDLARRLAIIAELIEQGLSMDQAVQAAVDRIPIDRRR
jgi:hypothetical protein